MTETDSEEGKDKKTQRERKLKAESRLTASEAVSWCVNAVCECVTNSLGFHSHRHWLHHPTPRKHIQALKSICMYMFPSKRGLKWKSVLRHNSHSAPMILQSTLNVYKHRQLFP